MFGQSWKIKKGTQWGAKKLLKKMGYEDNRAKSIARKIGFVAGGLVAFKTLDFIGVKAMLAEEFFTSSVEDSVADEITAEATEATVAGGAVATGAVVEGQPTFGASPHSDCAICGGDGLNSDGSHCWYCSHS